MKAAPAVRRELESLTKKPELSTSRAHAKTDIHRRPYSTRAPTTSIEDIDELEKYSFVLSSN